MNCSGNQFFTGSSLPGYEHSSVGRCDLFYLEEHIFGCVASAYDLVEIMSKFNLFPQVNILFFELVLELVHLFDCLSQGLVRSFTFSNILKSSSQLQNTSVRISQY